MTRPAVVVWHDNVADVIDARWSAVGSHTPPATGTPPLPAHLSPRLTRPERLFGIEVAAYVRARRLDIAAHSIVLALYVLVSLLILGGTA